MIADGVDRRRRPRPPRAPRRIDARGLVLAPGLVDLHTHLREPGFEHKETVETGTRAAAVGGYTAVASMANTDPVTDHAGDRRTRSATRRRRAGLCDVFPVGAITKGLEGESLAEMGEMVEAGVRVFSDDGHCVPSARLLRNALLYAKAFPRRRSSWPSTARTPRSWRAARCTRAALVHARPRAGARPRPKRSSWRATWPWRASTGGRLHLCHVSSGPVRRADPAGEGRGRPRHARR